MEVGKTDTASDEALIGTVVGGCYVLDAWLGKGGHGSVWRARHSETGGHVALKLFSGEGLDDPMLVRRFEAEAVHTHKLTHPNTVRAGDYGRTDDGGFFLAMEFVRGRSLRQVVEADGALHADRVVRIASQVLKSLGEAHEHALVHRDIKPANIMLVDQFGERDFVKVLDFGIARNLAGEGMNTRDILGTPRYMAPEQWMSLPVDRRTDLYSLGCVLYELLAGVPPFGPDDLAGAPNPTIGMMNAHVSRKPKPVAERARDAPAGLCRLIDRMLEKAPEARPQNASQALAELSSDGGELGSEHLEPPLERHVDMGTQTLPPLFAESLDTIDHDTLSEEPSPLRRWWLAVAAIAAVVVGLLAPKFSSAWDPPPPLPPERVSQESVAPRPAASVSDAAGTKSANSRSDRSREIRDAGSQPKASPREFNGGAALLPSKPAELSEPPLQPTPTTVSDALDGSSSSTTQTPMPAEVGPTEAETKSAAKKLRGSTSKKRKPSTPKRKLPRLL